VRRSHRASVISSRFGPDGEHHAKVSVIAVTENRSEGHCISMAEERSPVVWDDASVVGLVARDPQRGEIAPLVQFPDDALPWKGHRLEHR